MTTVLAVHGIGLRDADSPGLLPLITAAVTAADSSAKVRLCYWGESCGAALLAGGASLPADQPPASVLTADTDLWSLLDDDPQFELRLLAAQGDGSNSLPPHRRPVGDVIAARASELATEETAAADPQLSQAVAAAGLSRVFTGAVLVVLDAEPTRTALEMATEPAGELRAALGRAIVATAMARAGTPGRPLELDGTTVDTVVNLIVDRLGGPPELGLGRWLAGLAVARGVRYAERHRTQLTLGAVPYAGDVAKYLANGDALRAQIRAELAAAEPPVVVIAHSLGGVACVDVLTETDLPPVRALVTVGSQAPYLYEIDAMPRLRFGARLPDHFPRWLNVLDRRDLLAFAAERLFPGHAVDRMVDNRAPFPRAHSAYFSNPAFHALIAEVLA